MKVKISYITNAFLNLFLLSYSLIHNRKFVGNPCSTLIVIRYIFDSYSKHALAFINIYC